MKHINSFIHFTGLLALLKKGLQIFLLLNRSVQHLSTLSASVRVSLELLVVTQRSRDAVLQALSMSLMLFLA